jgi:crossover junction endodeoxyribonuclease RuvC
VKTLADIRAVTAALPPRMNTLAPGGRKILGIDLGLGGAIAVIDENGTLITVYDMPTLCDGTKGKRTINAMLLFNINAMLLFNILRQNPADHAYVEYVGPRPGEGAVGAFAFGRCRGIVEGVLGSLSIPTTFITPPCWKKVVGLPTGTGKDKSRSVAISRWPQHADLFARKKDDGRSDAALIAIAGLLRAGKLK